MTSTASRIVSGVVGRSRSRSGCTAIQLRFDQRHDLHAINAQPVDRPVDVGVEQHDAMHPGAAEIHLAEGRAGH
ncbi:MAG: hypothetical protein ACRDT6_11050 [Micromonosporaceae bacterium]